MLDFLNCLINCQVLGNVKYKIDACSKTYNNFPLLYLRAKVCLVKRLVENSTRLKQLPSSTSLYRMNTSTNCNQNQSTSPSGATTTTTTPPTKKKFTVDRILSIFFKPDKDNQASSPASSSSPSPSVSSRPTSSQTTPVSRQVNPELVTSVVELDLDESKTK